MYKYRYKTGKFVLEEDQTVIGGVVVVAADETASSPLTTSNTEAATDPTHVSTSHTYATIPATRPIAAATVTNVETAARINGEIKVPFPRLSDVLIPGKNGTLCLKADANIQLGKNAAKKGYKGDVKASDPPAPFDFKYDEKKHKYGAGTAFLKQPKQE
jgi:hypothetical protein